MVGPSKQRGSILADDVDHDAQELPLGLQLRRSNASTSSIKNQVGPNSKATPAKQSDLHVLESDNYRTEEAKCVARRLAAKEWRPTV